MSKNIDPWMPRRTTAEQRKEVVTMDRNCKYCKADCAHRGEDQETRCRGYTPMTKADRIRAMSDEMLARWINRLSPDGSYFCKNKTECETMLGEDADIPEENCIRCLVDWLRDPAEGNGE